MTTKKQAGIAGQAAASAAAERPDAGCSARLANSRRFFSFHARYSIDAGASLPELLVDGHSLLSSAVGVLSLIDLGTDEMFAVQHLLRQAEAVIAAASDLADYLNHADTEGGAA
jgi:hypothetical protein